MSNSVIEGWTVPYSKQNYTEMGVISHCMRRGCMCACLVSSLRVPEKFYDFFLKSPPLDYVSKLSLRTGWRTSFPISKADIRLQSVGL